MRWLVRAGFTSLLLAALATGEQDSARTITERTWHLGDTSTPEWDEAPAEPEGGELDLMFEARSFPGEGVLVVRHRGVDDAWHLELNGTRVARLEKGGLGEYFYRLPAGVVRDGANRLRLTCETATDDITVGPIRYHERPLRAALRLVPFRVLVTDGSGRPLPARVTITDERGELVRLFYAEELHAAVRNGVAYTSDGEAHFEVPAGSYVVHAVRGMEWSHASARADVGRGPGSVTLALEREVDTRGFVAADTHVHTLTYSGHGDASVEERLVTLAGEGVELAIATDHNHNTDYRPLQSQMGLDARFTSVVGNEVTTPVGHLNGFPLDPAAPIPPHELEDVAEIVAGIRAKGALAVILNHPRWPDHERGPHGVIGLDVLSGDWKGDWVMTYDAIELINSDTEQPDPMTLFRDWFALLNHGERIFGVGSSDSHTVGVVVGQGRTYVLSSTDDPASLHVETCARNIALGHTSVSMGIFCDIRRDGASIMGRTLSAAASGGRSPTEGIEVRIAAPSWVRPRRLELYANGRLVDERGLRSEKDRPFEQVLALEPSRGWPANDFWLVAVVHGDGVGAPWWPQLNDYTLAATNPVFIDVDGDGINASPRLVARGLLDRYGPSEEAFRGLFERVDAAVAVQLLGEVRRAWLSEVDARVRALGASAGAVHPEVEAWLEELERDL